MHRKFNRVMFLFDKNWILKGGALRVKKKTALMVGVLCWLFGIIFCITVILWVGQTITK